MNPTSGKRCSFPRRKDCFPVMRAIFSAFLVLSALILSSTLAWAAEGICKPGIVRLDGRFIPVSMRGGWASVRRTREVRLKFLGHSSFLITAPGGGRAVMDPYVIPILDPPPEAVTVSNFHETHSITGPYVGKSAIFFGVTKEGKPNAIDEKFGNLRISSFPQVDGDENHPFVLNTIHVFQAGGLCVAHFRERALRSIARTNSGAGENSRASAPDRRLLHRAPRSGGQDRQAHRTQYRDTDALFWSRIDWRVRKGSEGRGHHQSSSSEGHRACFDEKKTPSSDNLRGIARCRCSINHP